MKRIFNLKNLIGFPVGVTLLTINYFIVYLYLFPRAAITKTERFKQ